MASLIKVTSIDDNAILYFPRNIDKGSIVCHLGEAHLGTPKGYSRSLEVGAVA